MCSWDAGSPSLVGSFRYGMLSILRENQAVKPLILQTVHFFLLREKIYQNFFNAWPRASSHILFYPSVFIAFTGLDSAAFTD